MQALSPNHWPYLPRLLLTVATLRLFTLDRTTVASACFALYLVSMLMMKSFASPWLLVGWAALGIGFALSDKSIGPRPVFLALVALLVLHVMAIPGSLIWGIGNWELTAGVVLWMAPALLLYVAGTRQTLTWLIPAIFAHSGLIIYQGFTNWHTTGAWAIWEGQPTGLANNTGLAAGFLVLGLVYLLTTRAKWLAAPLFMALLFTGSRWGIGVGVAAVLVMAIVGQIDGRTLAFAIVGLLVAFIALGALTPAPYGIAGQNSFAAMVEAGQTDVGVRLAIPHIPSFLPRGVAEHPGLHNVPLRVAVESGIIAAALWIGITLWALMRWRNGVAWWVLLTLVALSMLDYYTWMGHLGGFWWLSVGLLVKGRQSSRQSLTLVQTLWSARASGPSLPTG